MKGRAEIEPEPHFACMRSGLPLTPTRSKNQLLIEVFGGLRDIYESLGDEWRSVTYKKVCARLQTFPAKITSTAQVKHVRGFGASILEKVEEILDTGGLKKLQALKNDPKVKALMELASIWGIGPKIACQLYDRGYRSVADLRQRGSLELTEQQRIGLSRHEDLQKRIPRSEAEEIENVVKTEAQKLVPGAQCVTCGSYRRGKASCGDVDVLIGPPEGEEEIQILPALINRLSEMGFLTDHLTLPSSHERRPGRTKASYMGVCRLAREGALYRRIDLKSYPRRIFPFALLYFTGSDHFNRSMRYYAQKVKSMTLSDEGLYPCKRKREGGSSKKVKIWKGAMVECGSEKDVFDALGLEYKEPWERNCDNIGILNQDNAALYGDGDETPSSGGEESDDST